MKKIDIKQIVPLVLAALAVVFAVVGFTQLGFWEDMDGPQPGFLPAIMTIVMSLASVTSLFQFLKEEKAAKHERDEVMVITEGAGITAGSFIIGLLPSCYLFVILWLKVFEKTGWKETLIVLAVCMVISIGVFRLWSGTHFPMGLSEAFLQKGVNKVENIQLLMHGFSTLFTFSNMGAAFLGAVLGLAAGAMPGIGSLAGVALLLPLTYKLNLTTAIIMLGALYYSNMYGDAFSAILLNIPEDSPTTCTTMDDYPMASKKKCPGQALFTVNMASFIGGTIGIIILTFTGPAPADIGLKFGPSEIMALLLIVMTPISWLVGENPVEGVMITMPGVLLVSIGMDTPSGSPRYDFGGMYLLGGIPPTPFTIDTVGLSQVIKLVTEHGNEVKLEPYIKLTIRGSSLIKHDFKRLPPPALQSGIMGTSVGVLPGTGAATGASMGYAAQKKFKNEEELGTGAIEGIAASEVVSNMAVAGIFAPFLALDIPGSGTGAVLLGGLMIWRFNLGPLLSTNEPGFTWGLIASLFLSSIFALVVAIGVISFLIQTLSVPVKYMIPTITIVCVAGPYSSSHSMYGVLIMFLSGILGYLLVKNDYPMAPMLLSSVLAKLLEPNIRKVFITSGGSLSTFSTRPITCALMLIFLAFICAPVIKAILKKAKEK